MEQPKLVFFFDEAHLLFNNAPKALLDKIEQVVRLIRSKGVGVYFITQSPEDIPDVILGQLGNRVQHALRAYTPRDQKAIRAAAESFRSDNEIDVEAAITNLKVGEALISFLDKEGRPNIVDVATILPPMSFMGPADEYEIEEAFKSHPYYNRYAEMVDRESAFEILRGKVEEIEAAEEAAEQEKLAAKEAALAAKEAERQAKEEARAQREAERAAREAEKEAARQAREAEKNDIFGNIMKSAGRAATSSIGRQIGSQIVRGILGSLLKK